MESTRGQIHSGLKTLASVLATQIWQGFRMWQLKEAAASLVPTNRLVPSAGEWGRGRMKRNLEGAMEVCSLLELLAGTLDPCRGVPRACKVQSRWVAAIFSSCLDLNPCMMVNVPPCNSSLNAVLGGKSISSSSSRTSWSLFPGGKRKSFHCCWLNWGCCKIFSACSHLVDYLGCFIVPTLWAIVFLLANTIHTFNNRDAALCCI